MRNYKNRVTIFLIVVSLAAVGFSQTADNSPRSNQNTMLVQLKNPEMIIRKRQRSLLGFSQGRSFSRPSGSEASRCGPRSSRG